MTIQILKDVIKRAESWPQEAQEELAEIAREIEAGLSRDVYRASAEERDGIDRGLKDARENRFATEDEVEAILAKYRPQ